MMVQVSQMIELKVYMRTWWMMDVSYIRNPLSHHLLLHLSGIFSDVFLSNKSLSFRVVTVFLLFLRLKTSSFSGSVSLLLFRDSE